MPTARIITVKGPIELTLFEDHAPNTVANFITLSEDGFYDGTKFHRVLKKFMAQGGDPNSKEGADGTPGSGGPGYTIKDEHLGEDFRRHFAGTLSMANRSAPNTGGSQFFITHLPTTHLDGRHTVFGRVTSGLDVVRNLEVDDEILSITITSKRDHDYTPETIGKSSEKAVKPKPPVKGNPGLTTSSQGN
ncbi:MAG: peptidyl-prolyl cis-trans isomerase [Phycisphaerae bacterium]|nr:peptidyl-prolyl cis-trans isomerase [Phycisphaerae bacterium]